MGQTLLSREQCMRKSSSRVSLSFFLRLGQSFPEACGTGEGQIPDKIEVQEGVKDGWVEHNDI